MGTRAEQFATQLAAGRVTVGTFVKTPSAIVCEVLGLTDLDVCCLDAEHAPFGRFETDACLAALRAADMPSLVRVANDSATEIRCALDAGATGILVPHVTNAAQAAAIVRNSHFGEGGRGFAGSTRAARYTTKPMAQHLRDSASASTVILQIEDLAALDQVDAIAAVPGVHALFIGRADLAVAMGKPVDDPAVVDAVANICRSAAAQGRAVGMFTPRLEELGDWQAQGASFFLLGSDQSFMLQGAARLTEDARRALDAPG